MSQQDREQITDIKETTIIANNPNISEELQVNINEVKDSYDSFLYVSKPFSSTNINNLQAKAKLYGLNPAPLKGARILELGASCGAISSRKHCTIQKQLSQASTYQVYRYNMAMRLLNP